MARPSCCSAASETNPRHPRSGARSKRGELQEHAAVGFNDFALGGDQAMRAKHLPRRLFATHRQGSVHG